MAGSEGAALLFRKAMFVVGLIALTDPIGCAPDMELVSSLCNTESYSFGDPFGGNLDYVLKDLVHSTAAHDSDYKNISPKPVRFVYGHGKCSDRLSVPDCKACLSSITEALPSQCGKVVGARMTLVDCFIRYEAYPFSSSETSSVTSSVTMHTVARSGA